MSIIANNKALAYFRFRLGEMKVMIALNCLLSLAGFPLIGAVMAYYTGLEPVNMGPQPFNSFNLGYLYTIVPLAVISILLLAFSIGVSSFSHLHNKNICDMHLSLPMTHRQRFWSNFTAGLTAAVVPFALSYPLGLAIFKIFGKESSIMKILNQYFLDPIGGIDQVIADYVFPIALIVFVTIVMVYTMTVFCSTLCGNGFTATFLPMLLSAVIPLLVLTLSTTALRNVRGIDSLGNYAYTISSPIGFAAGSLYMFQSHDIFTVNMPVYIIPVMLIIAGLIAGSFFLSKNVKAENIGRDFLYKSTYNVQQALVCLCIISLFGIFSGNTGGISAAVIPWAVTISLVVYTIGHIVHYKGFRKIRKGLVKYAALLTLSVLICVGLAAGKGFGAENYIPNADNIQGVKIETWGWSEKLDGQITVNSALFTPDNSWNFIRRDDCESDGEWQAYIEEARRIHRLLLDNGGEVTNARQIDYRYGNFNVTVEYELKNGLVVTRRYNFTENEMNAMIDNGYFVYYTPNLREPEAIDYGYSEHIWQA